MKIARRQSFASLIVFALAIGFVGGVRTDDLRKPPSAAPADLPRVVPLLVDANGRAITNSEDWQKQRSNIRQQWIEFMGGFPNDVNDKCELKAETLATESLDGFERQLVRYQVESDVWVQAYLLRPVPASDRAGAKLPAMVVFHQTTAETIRSPGGLDDKPELHMGVQLARRGYVAVCPECFIFSRSEGYAKQVEAMQRRHPTWKGMTRMTWDGIRAVDFLESLPYVDRDRIGGIGHSLGSKEVMFAAAFDERFKVAVASEGGVGLTFSNWHDVWYLGPDIRKPDFPLENHQIISLIAPRAFLLLAGDSADNDRSWAFIHANLPLYRLFGAEKNIGWFNHREGHRFSPQAQEVAYRFIDGILR